MRNMEQKEMYNKLNEISKIECVSGFAGFEKPTTENFKISVRGKKNDIEGISIIPFVEDIIVINAHKCKIYKINIEDILDIS